MGFGVSKHEKGDKGKKVFGKAMMGAAKIAAKAATNEIGDLGDMGDLGEGGEVLEGAAKFAAKTAVKTAAKQIQDKDHKKSDHDKEATGNKDNSKAAIKLGNKITSMAIDAATDSDEGNKVFGKAMMGAAKIAAKAATNEIGDLGDMGDLGEGGELLEGAAKFAAKTAVKTAAKQIQEKDHINSDHDKEATGNKDNRKAATIEMNNYTLA